MLPLRQIPTTSRDPSQLLGDTVLELPGLHELLITDPILPANLNLCLSLSHNSIFPQQPQNAFR